MDKKPAAKRNYLVIPRISDGKRLAVFLRKRLGHGSFGCAYLARVGKTLYVCKAVDLEAIGDYVRLLPHQLLRVTYREIYYLRKREALIGYHHDKEKKLILILMKLVPGTTEFEVEGNELEDIEYASFCAMRELHRANIAHMDPNVHNFMYQHSTKKAQAIDFGLSEDHQLVRELYDFHEFVRLRSPSLSAIFFRDNEYGPTYLARFYTKELYNHFINHKWQSLYYGLYYTTILLAAFSGLSVFGPATMLAQELIKVSLLQFLSEFLEFMQNYQEQIAFDQLYDKNTRIKHYLCSSILVILQVLILLVQLSAFLLSLPTLNQGDPFDIVEGVRTLIYLKPLFHALNYWQDNIEKYLLNDDMLIARYEHKISGDLPKTLLPLFQHKPTPAAVKPDPISPSDFKPSL